MKAIVSLFLMLIVAVLTAYGQGTIASVAALTQRAEAGEAQAQVELGRAYEDGKDVPQDYAKAVEWFRKSAEQGNAQAQNSLGVMYAQGRGVQGDREEAIRWYRKAAKQNSPEAIYNIAISYYNGEGVEANLNDAATWMMVASRKGDAQATEALKQIIQELHQRMNISKFQLAQLYNKGDEIPQDLPGAVSLYRELAEQEDEMWYNERSRYQLCQLYATGKGVPQDYAKAKSWCKKSRTDFSYMVLGRMAEQGLGQSKNLREALGYYKEAAFRAVPDGYMDTARLELASGAHDAQKNAYFWYLIAIKRKVPGAEEKLREVATHLTEKEITKQQQQATAWLRMRDAERFENLKKH
ncbi:MAG: sel1 repeat family protein [Acidobacteriia bacterium]|nr:sel1 repeat family protein [Terriglobia bacterium]